MGGLDAGKFSAGLLKEPNETESRHLKNGDEPKTYQDKENPNVPEGEDLEELKRKLRVMDSKLKEVCLFSF